MKLELATPADSAAIASVRNAAAAHLTAVYGKGHWSSDGATEKSVLRGMAHAKLLVARDREEIVGTLSLVTKKPWAIDPAYFQTVARAIYLVGMAVVPNRQRHGVGRRLLEHAAKVARAWPANAIRLDAYDAPAGAGAFYARCGYSEVGRVKYRKTPLVYYELLLSNSDCE